MRAGKKKRKRTREGAGNEREARACGNGNVSQDNSAVLADYFFIPISYLDRSSAQGNAKTKYYDHTGVWDLTLFIF